MSSKKALILHCWHGTPNDHWYPWLKQELTNLGFNTDIPDLLTMRTNTPNLNTILEIIDNTHFVDDKATIIGHSLGCLAGLRLAEKTKFERLVLVAGWDFDDLTVEHKSFWTTKIDHEQIKNNVKKIFCISSDNDPYISAYQAEEMAKRLNAKFILIKGAGHFTKDYGIGEIPEILEILNNDD